MMPQSLRAAGVLIALLVATATQAQDEPLKKKFQVTVPYDGPEIFARLLDHAGLRPLASLDRLEVDAPAEKTIIIVFANGQPLLDLEGADGGVKGFLDRGGALLFASDRHFAFSRLPSLDWTEDAIDGRVFVNDTGNYRGEWRCPLLRPDDIADAELNFPFAFLQKPNIGPKKIVPPHPVFRDVGKPIATNCPTALVLKHRSLRPLAFLPQNSAPELAPDHPEFGVLADPRPRQIPYIAASEQNRVLLVAGHGAFTNCMTVQDDIDNRLVALNAIRWLQEDQRTHVLFLHDDKPVTNFKNPLIGPPKTPMPSVEAINRIIGFVEKSGLLQKIADRVVGRDRAIRGAILLVTFGLLFYGCKKYFQSRWTLDAASAVVGVPPAKASPLVEQQVGELLARNQLGAPARALARDWFETYAKSSFSAGYPPTDLVFEIRAGLLQRRHLRHQIEKLWMLATQPPPADWNGKKFRELSSLLEGLSLSVVAGEVVFESAVASGGRS